MRVRSTFTVPSDRPRAGRRRGAAVMALAVAGGVLAAPVSGSAAGLAGHALPGVGSSAGSISDGLRTTSATIKKTNCSSLSRKAKKAKGDQRKWLQKQARKCPGDNKRLTQALKAIGDGRYVGKRGDGEPVDWTICANGKYKLLNSGSYGTSVSEGTKWQITWSQASGSKGFVAILEDRDPDGGGLSVGLSLRSGKWGVGIASFGSEVNKIGAVTRTDAKADCAAL